jgi:hypothetical protein
LGSAYTALANNAYAPVWNPAGLGSLADTEIAAQQLFYLQSINYEFASFVHPLSVNKGLGFSAQYLGTGNIAETDTNGNSAGSYSDHYGAYSIAYGQQLTEKLSLGLTARWINAQLAEYSANAYAGDVGFLYQASNHLKLALTADNFGSKLTFIDQADTLPQAVHFAAAYQPEKHLNLAAEGVYNTTGLVSGRVGVEWIPIEMIRLRAGYRTDTTDGLSALAGLSTGVGIYVAGQEFSYAWVPYGDLGDTQYFSLLLRFGQAAQEKRNLIQYHDIKRNRTADLHETDPEYQQLMQLLSDSEKPALAQKP